MAANALDYDDTGPTGHPGATIIPAALALAESRDLRGETFLLAVLVGYETWARIRGAIQPSWERRVNVYGNGVTQTFGAAAACAAQPATPSRVSRSVDANPHAPLASTRIPNPMDSDCASVPIFPFFVVKSRCR